MIEKKEHQLKIDKAFKNLIRPLQRKEFLQLEGDILENGCREPIVVYDGFIIDGHNRYEICTKHNIPFSIAEMAFECKEKAIAWICAHQLCRRNITDETRKFLIGMQYESEKIVNSRKNVLGVNQYSKLNSTIPYEGFEINRDRSKTFGHITAQKIAHDNHVSIGSVQKYAMYTRALEVIGKADPAMVPRILSGRYKISHQNVIDLSRMPPEEIRKVGRKIERSQQTFVQYKRTSKEIHEGSTENEPIIPTGPTVKDMPQFDPDAEITGLTLTIPSWGSSIERIRTKTDLSIVSAAARAKLTVALKDLLKKIDDMLDAIKED